jgi:hypothetical protein
MVLPRQGARGTNEGHLPVSFVASRAMWSARNRKAELLAEQLRSCRSTAASGIMIRLLGMDSEGVRRAAAVALLEMAPFWTEEEFAALTGEERARLRKMVVGYGSVSGPYRTSRPVYPVGAELRAVLCKKLGWLGNSEDLRALKVAQTLSAITPGQRRVKQAASESIAIMQARQADMASSGTVLRASGQPSAQPEELVRPASASSAVSAQDLLRSGDQGPENR